MSLIDFDKILLDDVCADITRIFTYKNLKNIGKTSEKIRQFLLKIRQTKDTNGEEEYRKSILIHTVHEMGRFLFPTKISTHFAYSELNALTQQLNNERFIFFESLMYQRSFIDIIFKDISELPPVIMKLYCDLCMIAPETFIPILFENNVFEKPAAFIVWENGTIKEKSLSCYKYFRYISSEIKKTKKKILKNMNQKADDLFENFLEKRYNRNKNMLYDLLIENHDVIALQYFILNEEENSYFSKLTDKINKKITDCKDFEIHGNSLLTVIEIEKLYRNTSDKIEFYQQLLRSDYVEYISFYLSCENNEKEKEKILEFLNNEKYNCSLLIKEELHEINKDNIQPIL